MKMGSKQVYAEKGDKARNRDWEVMSVDGI